MTTDGLQNTSVSDVQSGMHKLSSHVTSKESAVPALVGRLEHELESLESIGFKSQPWKADLESSSSIATATIEIDWLIAQRELPYLVQAIPSHLIYRSIMNHGVEDSLEVVEWVRGGALVRLLDYDLWTSPLGRDDFLSGSEEPSGERFVQWIKWWNEITPEFAAQRVVELDEGLIVGCMTAACEIIPVGLNRSQEELSDEYWMTPDNRFGLKMKTSEPSDFEVFHQFIHSLYAKDIRLAQAILSHSAMLLREESIDEARRWRAGRLEDQGFLPADEARHLLNPKSNKQLVEMVRRAMSVESGRASTSINSESSENTVSAPLVGEEDIRERLFEFVQTRDAEELAEEIEQTLGVSELVRLIGTSAPQIDALLQDEDVMDTFVDNLTARTNQVLRALEVHKARALREKLYRKDETVLMFDQAIAWLSENEIHKVMDFKSRIARMTNGVAAAMGVANESTELARVLTAVRGCLNVGLERLLKEPETFSLPNMAGTKDAGNELNFVSQAAAVLTAAGPEAIFQVGWQTLQDVAMEALQMLVHLVDNNQKLKNEVGSEFVVQLSDGEQLKLSVLQLQSRGRYLEVRKWLKNLLVHFEPAIQFILESTLNRLPVFPIVLLEENQKTRANTNAKVYEKLEETEKARFFFRQLPHLVGVTGQGE